MYINTCTYYSMHRHTFPTPRRGDRIFDRIEIELRYVLLPKELLWNFLQMSLNHKIEYTTT